MNWRTLHFRKLDARGQKRLGTTLLQSDDALARDDYRTALRLGQELQKQRQAGGFALEARAHRGLGRVDRAIDALQRGLKQFGAEWPLWVELGTMYAAQRNFEQAYQAYAYARTLKGADAAIVDLHKALALSDDNHHLDAIDILVNMETADIPVRVEALVAQVEIFNAQDGAEFVFVRVDRALTLIKKDAVHDYTDALVRLHTGAGRACLVQNDRPGALSNAQMAISVRRGGCGATLELLRDIHDQRSRTSHYYNLLAQGRGGAGQPFVTTYGVVAESPEEGLEFTREVENDPVACETLMLQEAEDVEPAPGALHGVYTIAPIYHTE